MLPPSLEGSLVKLCITIVWSLLAAPVYASLFGVSPNISPFRRLTPSSVANRLRGGGDTPGSRPHLPYTLAIRDSIMIGHSFHGHPSFGPAGGMHGATYTVDVEFASASLHPECNWVIDIGAASDLVSDVLKKYNYKNLDDVFGKDVMTTTEFMCKVIFDGVVDKLAERQERDGDKNGFSGWIKVTLSESHKAWASFEGPSS